MKKLALFLLLLFNFGWAQNKSSDLETTFYKFQKLNEIKNYEEAFNYYYQGFFEIVPKAELLNDLSKLDNNPNYEYLVKDSKIISVSEIFEKDKIKYALIKYTGKTYIKFNDSSDSEMIELIKENAKNIYGDTYSYSELKKEISFIKKDSELIAVTDKGWKFFAYSDNIKSLIKTIVPNDILKSILAERK